MSILDALRGISGYSGGEVRPSLRKIWPGLGSLCAGGEHTVDVKTVRHLFSESFTKWSDDDAPSLGAALAFYTILSMSPLVIFVVAIVSLVFSRSSAQALLMAQVQSLIGASGRDAIAMMLANGHRHWHGLFSSSLGFLTLIFGASGVFGELRSALNKIWKAKPRAASSLMILARGRLFSFGMVVSVGFVLLVSLIASTGLAAMTKYFSGVLPFPAIFWEALNFLVSFAGVTVLFALILKYVPETKIAWEDVRLGAVFTALLFVLGKMLLALYLGRASPGSPYGAAGSVVVVVIWVYYSAQIFYFGAELTHVYAMSRRKTAQGEDYQSNVAA
jgi:membrane protein